MTRVAATIDLSAEERKELEGLSRRRRTAQGLAQRAEIVLLASKGLRTSNPQRVGAVENTVGKWHACLLKIGWMASTMSRGRVGHVRSAM